jgi:hypothetical protein
MDTRRMVDSGITYEQGITMVYIQLQYYILVKFVLYPVRFSVVYQTRAKQKQTASLQ